MHRLLSGYVTQVAITKWICHRQAVLVEANVIGGPAVDCDRGYTFRRDRGATAQTFLDSIPNRRQIPAQVISVGYRTIGDSMNQGNPRSSFVPPQQGNPATFRPKIDGDPRQRHFTPQIP